jgi:DNA-binding Lrp family transcriptional regulator
VHQSPERRYAEEAGIVLGGMGLPPAHGKLLGWLFICEPPSQTSTQLADALGLSRASVSTGMRQLERTGLARRVPVPGHRGHAYELKPDVFVRVAAEPTRYRVFRELLDRGLALRGGPGAPGTDRLRLTRDFYAFLERELPKLAEQFMTEQSGKGDGDG